MFREKLRVDKLQLAQVGPITAAMLIAVVGMFVPLFCEMTWTFETLLQSSERRKHIYGTA